MGSLWLRTGAVARIGMTCTYILVTATKRSSLRDALSARNNLIFKRAKLLVRPEGI
jgi:hypothetical protein